jgi:hypothetical protein
MNEVDNFQDCSHCKSYAEVDYYKPELPKGILLQGFEFGKVKTNQDD